MLRKSTLALAVGMAWASAPAIAAGEPTSSPESAPARLGEVTVSATRTERRVDNVPNTVTVTTSEDAEQEGARDLKSLFSDELGVEVRTAPARFTAAGAATGRAGSEGINIRGLEGNQVLMLVDGVRVPNGFSFASFATGRADYLDVDGIRTAEILRGPASTQFGSDGLAGAVSFRTLDPADLLKAGRSVGGFVRTGYASVDRSWNNTVGVAGRSDAWQGMLQATYRKGHEVDNKGTNDAPNSSRTEPNPADYNSRYVLAKALYTLNATNQFGLTLESQNRKQDTEVYSARAVPPLTSTSAIDLDTHDRITRDRVSLEHRYTDLNAPWMQRAETRLYWQDAKVEQLSIEDRLTAADRTRDNTYKQGLVGLSSLFESNLVGATSSINQRISYGFDWNKSKVEGVRDGTVPPFGETFPTKPFPDTDYTLAGAFVQDEIEAGAVSVIPGLRFDYYKLKPSTDGFTGGATTTLTDNAVTPRLGVVWRAAPQFAPYAQWAKGFRAPTPDQVNNGFTNLASGYTSIGNPNLKAERADSIELGVRSKFNALRTSVAIFDNSYDDFISQQAVGGAGTPANPTVFQYVNLANARIRGAEARAEWQFNSRWVGTAGIAYAKGDSETNGVKTPLDTISPLKAVLGVRYDAGTWGARVNLTHSAAKSASNVGTVPGPTGAPTAQFTSPSWTTVDVGVTWKPMANLTVVANLNNLFDETYWRWSDVRGLAANSNVVDAYTAPGRNLQASIRYDF
ncbi:TonB-dependent hemoglobin/transferrin/lactoferrin family receptor [Noviherbaspirillum cavernae]|uniref:TonB-dependent hemoglobin/transferrin/lactoferrin family receptor n=1 Tax=Noviherbaspirillum cavernae TaxID=2320862 RepID=A0A418WX96_9BURK|nr:TonB-dependent hemoglobin/transferrin/lactoferrin family receptor [Noviherbaspirillum cavernae]RJG04715.1 TonB-dependent hemoglobin/transferrin/lactoferrin family receptor [Noviherbaspirillum cavernae]